MLGSAHLTKWRIPAARTIFVGSQISIPTQTPVARIEVVFVSARSTEPLPSTPLLISDVVAVPDSRGYLSSVRGQVLNKHPTPLTGGFSGSCSRTLPAT